MIIKKIQEVVLNPKRILAFLWSRVGSHFVSDELYLTVRCRLLLGYKADIRNPKTFNEKINWLKLNNKNPLYPRLVDKYLVKEYVANTYGGV